MKKLSLLLLPFAAALLFFVACQKEQTVSTPGNASQNAEISDRDIQPFCPNGVTISDAWGLELCGNHGLPYCPPCSVCRVPEATTFVIDFSGSVTFNMYYGYFAIVNPTKIPRDVTLQVEGSDCKATYTVPEYGRITFKIEYVLDPVLNIMCCKCVPTECL